ncbi:MAG: proton-conducting transporter membrane subunit, partial [Nitrospiria bacterium]
MTAVLTIVFLPFLASLAILFLSPWLQKMVVGKKLGATVALVPLICLTLILSWIPQVKSGLSATFHIPWVESYGIALSFLVDGLSLLFGILISGIGLLVVIYSIWYLSDKEDKVKFYLYLMMFMGAMLGVVFSNNLFGMFTFWELTSISSFLLIGFWYHKEASRYGATKALVITGLGGIAMLAGFIVLYQITETFDVTKILTMGDVIRNSPLYVPALILIFLGCATKSAQFPFHIWLPNAMEAPTPVSAYLHSATMVKAGIFLTARLSPAFSGTAFWTALVAGFGLTTMLVAGVLAIRQTDLKALLAYSTISQLGMIMAMLGFGTQYSGEAAIVHIMNHAAFKAALFMIVGIIDHGCGTRDLTYVGNLRKEMPHSFRIAFVGCLSMAGLPIFGGFISKEMFYESTLHIPFAPLPYLIPALAVFASLFTFAYSFKFLIWGFFYEAPEHPPHHPHEAPTLGLVSPVFLAVMVVLLGIAPGLFSHGLLEPAAAAVTGQPAELHLGLWHGVNTPLVMSFFTVVFGVLLFMRLKKVNAVQDEVSVAVPWLSPNFVYNRGFLAGIPPLTQRCLWWFQSGYLKHYLMAIFTFLMLSTVFFSLSKGWVLHLDALLNTDVTLAQLITFVLLVCAALAT